MQLEKNNLNIAFIASYLIAIVSIFWVFKNNTYGPLIVALSSVTALAGSVIAIYIFNKKQVSENTGIKPSPLTPDSPLLNKLMEGAIATVCRGVSVPQTPESADLSAFIFKLERNELICSHYWSPNPRQEQVGINRFELKRELANQVAVVRAALDKAPCRTSVDPIPDGTNGVRGAIYPELNFVLASPILNEDKSVWGVVDFDSGNDAGKTLLMNTVSDSVMYHLAEHLRLIFSLAESKFTQENA